jgi:hypothetical protein
MRPKLDAFVRKLSNKRNAVIASVVVGAVVLTAGGAFAARAATNQFADATIDRLGNGDPQAVLDSIAKSVVEKLTSKNGVLGTASKDITDKLGKAAGSTLAGIDTDSLINQVSDEVVAAGMGMLDGISTDAIVQQVTNALIESALAEVEALDLQALTAGALDDAVEDLLASVDLEKLIKEKLDEVDVEAIVADVVSKKLGGDSGGLLGMLINR